MWPFSGPWPSPFGPPARLGGERVEHRPLVDPVVPDLEIAHLGVAADALAVGAHDRAGGLGGLALSPPMKRAATAALAARRFRSHSQVPDDLVEVVDREHEVALGRAKTPKLETMHVAAGVDEQAGTRRTGEVARHDRGRAAQEGEGRGQHAGKADRHQLLHAAHVLLLEDRDRIGAVRVLVEPGVLGAGHLVAQRLAAARRSCTDGRFSVKLASRDEIPRGLREAHQVCPVSASRFTTFIVNSPSSALCPAGSSRVGGALCQAWPLLACS